MSIYSPSIEHHLTTAMAYFSLRKVGFLIDTFEKPCVLADALVPDCPVIGVSDSFAKLSATAMVARNATWVVPGGAPPSYKLVYVGL